MTQYQKYLKDWTSERGITSFLGSDKPAFQKDWKEEKSAPTRFGEEMGREDVNRAGEPFKKPKPKAKVPIEQVAKAKKEKSNKTLLNEYKISVENKIQEAIEAKPVGANSKKMPNSLELFILEDEFENLYDNFRDRDDEGATYDVKTFDLLLDKVKVVAMYVEIYYKKKVKDLLKKGLGEMNTRSQTKADKALIEKINDFNRKVGTLRNNRLKIFGN